MEFLNFSFFCFRKEGGSRKALGLSNVLGVFNSFLFREEFRDQAHMSPRVCCLFPCCGSFPTGTEPDRQVDPLERKHPYFLPCPLVKNQEEAM